jgi:hypothetical protein
MNKLYAVVRNKPDEKERLFLVKELTDEEVNPVNEKMMEDLVIEYAIKHRFKYINWQLQKDRQTNKEKQ